MIPQLTPTYRVTTPSSPQPLVVFLPGPDRRFLGGSLLARNERVAERGGASVVELELLATFGRTPVVLVPPGVGIDLLLFQVEPPDHPVWLTTDPAAPCSAADSRGVLAGPAHAFYPLPLPSDLVRLPRVQVDERSVHVLSTASFRRQATWTVLLATSKPTDGWVARHCNRPISRLVSYVMLGLGLSANHASALTLAVGFLAAAIAAQPGHLPFVIMGILFQLASVLDGVDGEIARATLTESETGARIDTIVDQVTYVA